jgi:hypothetical protein
VLGIIGLTSWTSPLLPNEGRAADGMTRLHIVGAHWPSPHAKSFIAYIPLITPSIHMKLWILTSLSYIAFLILFLCTHLPAAP